MGDRNGFVTAYVRREPCRLGPGSIVDLCDRCQGLLQTNSIKHADLKVPGHLPHQLRLAERPVRGRRSAMLTDGSASAA